MALLASCFHQQAGAERVGKSVRASALLGIVGGAIRIGKPIQSQAVPHEQIDLHPRRGEKAADVKLIILNEGNSVLLQAIVVRESRPGWIPMELPTVEID